MTSTGSLDLQALRSAMKGSVIGRDDPAYDEARKVWNADIDRHPTVIARCETSADVAASVAFARGQRLEIAVRAGAHSMPGHS
ncbi:MAG: FAD-dependent oxidoreductase, partial [Actinobacteria bacterium]|nr:FAD-dependent oxidoreductase [Actinomycetota bacterium]